MKIILFTQSGGLGNQIFQYAGIKKNFIGYRPVFFGFRSLSDTFNISGASFLVCRNTKFSAYIRRAIHYAMLFASKRVGFICYAHEDESRDSDIKVVNGWIKGVVYLDVVYFQKHEYINVIKELDFKIKEEIIDDAKSKIRNFPSSNSAFIHIRGGDYQFWPSVQYPAILPEIWYENAISKILEANSEINMVCITDDIPYASTIIKNFKNIKLIKNSESIDFAIMTICKYGVISASTFALTAVIIAKNQNLKLIIAPKFWAGYHMNKWYPENFIAAKLDNFEWI